MFIVCQIRDKRTQFKEVDLALKIITFNNSRILAIARGQRTIYKMKCVKCGPSRRFMKSRHTIAYIQSS